MSAAPTRETSMHFQTRCVHAGVAKDAAFNSVITPIYPSATFAWDDLQTNRGFDYTRSGNPTRKALEENIAALEGGIDCKATATGMAAITAVMHLFQPGDHIIVPGDAYGGTYRLIAQVLAPWGIEHTAVPLDDVDAVRAAVRPNTAVLWVETPTNPLLGIADIALLSAVAREAGALDDVVRETEVRLPGSREGHRPEVRS